MGVGAGWRNRADGAGSAVIKAGAVASKPTVEVQTGLVVAADILITVLVFLVSYCFSTIYIACGHVGQGPIGADELVGGDEVFATGIPRCAGLIEKEAGVIVGMAGLEPGGWGVVAGAAPIV